LGKFIELKEKDGRITLPNNQGHAVVTENMGDGD